MSSTFSPSDRGHSQPEPDGPGRSTRRGRRRARPGGRSRSALLAAGVLTVVCSPLAVAATGSGLLEGVRNGTTAKETEIIGSQEARSGKGGYVTRQSNVSTGAGAGGAAIYGCRAPVGGTTAGSAPCLRASNLAGGNAFEFSSTGPVGGLISVGDPTKPNPGKPFVTNATGVATGLNADKVDGLDAAQIAAAATGAPGPKGDAGAKGDTGAPGALGAQGTPGPSGPARSNDGSSCIPTDSTFVVCRSTTLTLPAAGRVLIIGDMGWYNTGAAGTAAGGRCRLDVDGFALSTSDRDLGELQKNTERAKKAYVGLNHVTRALAAGDHTFSLLCNLLAGSITYADGSISAMYAGGL
ncbi:MAG: hypothetical protein H0V81_08980 [Solirubrobacterales bacterium]|nr:hypothetical protein [Solirubrobacterales bacterium]